jgi:hypothetical protein
MKTRPTAHPGARYHKPRIAPWRGAVWLLGIATAILNSVLPCLAAEAAAPTLTMDDSVLLNWPANTAEEQIVLGASSLASNAVWTPWPEPIFQRHGALSMAVPASLTEQYFRLAPGSQFVDSFDPPKWPCASRGSWVPGFYEPADAGRWEITATNGVLLGHTRVNPTDGRVPLRPPGPDLALADFRVSVDILHLDASVVGTGAGFAIGARVGGDPGNWPGLNNGYLGGVNSNFAGKNLARLTIWTGSSGTDGALFTFKPGAPYRLIFSGVGNQLSVAFIDLTTGQPAVETLKVTDSTFSQGFVGLWIEAGQGQYDVTLDNFFVTGTKP